jgi:CBS domain-containing protein
MLARDLMRKEVLTIEAGESVATLMDVLVREHVHGLPVVDERGRLVGMVTQQDIFFANVTLDRQGNSSDGGEPSPEIKVRDIMTSPAVSADEDTEVLSLCKMLTRLRIHRVPIVRDGKITGIISSLDICAALERGEFNR